MYCHLFPWENRLGRYKQIGSLIVTLLASSGCCLSCLENASARGVTSCKGWFCVPDWGLQVGFSFPPFLLFFFFCLFPFFSQKYDRSSVRKDFWTAFPPFLILGYVQKTSGLWDGSGEFLGWLLASFCHHYYNNFHIFSQMMNRGRLEPVMVQV